MFEHPLYLNIWNVFWYAMARVTVLGGCGVVGTVAVKTLISAGDFSEIIIGDIDLEKANECVSQIGDECLSSFKVDASDPAAVKQAIKGSDVVLNCCGPFYRLGPVVLKAVIESKINYVDVCDDYDATKKLLDMNGAAKKAGISALTGMGSSPGVANLLVKFCADLMLDKVDSIDILHAHGGEPTEGAAVVAHRIHSMTSPIPMYLNGKFTTVDYFGESGKALEEDVTFHYLGTYRCYPYPHPETITLPNYIKCKRVTNLGCVIPPQYYRMIQEIARLGIVSETPLAVGNQMVVPRDFSIAFIIQQRERILKEAKFGEQRGCLKITIKGIEDGEPKQYDFSMASIGQSMGEGTGIPAALGAILMQRGKITEKGVLPPEACVKPLDFLGLMQEHLKLDKMTGGESPLIIESIDKSGKIERLQM
ncbi:MAG: saccharopine dehydrogenase NADP-binding domain-containing protein [Candidatus Thorarchaeota archaeon]|nr:saccharopine dehydrogenase NADP-binding domain-containing protein [Candidatus Thorarchaeota archaeon]